MTDLRPCRGTILIVDDQENNIRILERMLRKAGYEQLVSSTDPRDAQPLFDQHRPDLVLLDLHMPHLDGFGVLERLAPYIAPGTYMPILVLTADISPEAKQRALSMGAKDFLAKPFDSTEVLLRIRNLLEGRFLYLELQEQNELLEQKVRLRTRELEEAQVEILERLALAAEYRDDATQEHTRRVGEISARLAQRMGMPPDVVELIRRAAPLHDLGKIAVPDSILLKLGKLTDQEFAIIRSHTTIGARILSGSRHPLLQLAEQIALTHHEHWDGKGYQPGLGGERIPVVSRIVAVADVFDALTHTRPYKKAWSVERACAEIQAQSGRQFDPQVVDAFLDLVATSGLGPADPRLEDDLEEAIPRQYD
ncbi:MAG: response regulator [Acidobacteria bacterium]|nr:response regulator [Acidobacteriota bacterium]